MWRRVDLVWTDVSKELISSIFRVEKSASEEPPAHTTSQKTEFLIGITCRVLENLTPTSTLYSYFYFILVLLPFAL
jgi:hypothetical protein